MYLEVAMRTCDGCGALRSEWKKDEDGGEHR
jgi:hypothetical protein